MCAVWPWGVYSSTRVSCESINQREKHHQIDSERQVSKNSGSDYKTWTSPNRQEHFQILYPTANDLFSLRNKSAHDIPKSDFTRHTNQSAVTDLHRTSRTASSQTEINIAAKTLRNHSYSERRPLLARQFLESSRRLWKRAKNKELLKTPQRPRNAEGRRHRRSISFRFWFYHFISDICSGSTTPEFSR